VIGIPGGWSSERLADAVGQAAGYRKLIDPARMWLDVETGQVWADDLDLCTLDGLIVKKLGPAYSPKLLDRLEFLHYLEGRGVRVFSRPQGIGRVLSRFSGTVDLARAGIPMPPTVVTEDLEAAVRTVQTFGRAVLKPLFTSKARGMVVVEPGPTLREEIANYQLSIPGQDVVYIQKMIDLPGHDLGLVFLGGRYLACYARVGRRDAWNTTTASGGRYRAYQPSEEVIETAARAQAVFGLDFTSVDVAETTAGPMVFEVSAFGGLRGLLEGCGIDGAALYARYVLEELGS
jgi:ribosomal protein S6--L-glutamate ligase